MLKSNKIKVTMNAQDLSELGISIEAMAKNSPESREVFFELLRRAEKETGFSYNNSRLVVEAAVQAEKVKLHSLLPRLTMRRRRRSLISFRS